MTSKTKLKIYKYLIGFKINLSKKAELKKIDPKIPTKMDRPDKIQFIFDFKT